MKSALLCVSVVLLTACGAHEDAGHRPSPPTASTAAATPAPAAHGEVTDERIGLPVYPGAKEIEYSRIKLHSDIGDTYSVRYTSNDSPAQVAAFYRAEGEKVGKLKESVATSEQLKSVGVDRTDGTQSAIQAMTDNKGVTVISLHRFFPSK